MDNEVKEENKTNKPSQMKNVWQINLIRKLCNENL